MELTGTTAVITGSSGRLGGAVAEALAKAGCKCICHYNSNKEKAEDTVSRIRKIGVEAVAVWADLTEAKQIEDLFEKAKEIGRPQILINSAAVFSRQRLDEVTFEEVQKVLNLKLTSAILTSRAFAEAIKDKGGESEPVVGGIINISDVGGIRPWAEYVVYCSSKAGLIGATKALAKELAPAVCVNAVAPGVITWPGDFNELDKQRQLSFIPVRRIARISEVTDAIIFLLENDYITGQVLCVDGGRCM